MAKKDKKVRKAAGKAEASSEIATPVVTVPPGAPPERLAPFGLRFVVGSLLLLGFFVLLFFAYLAWPEKVDGSWVNEFGTDDTAILVLVIVMSAIDNLVKGAAGGAVVGAATGAISGDADAGAGYGAIWGATRSGIDGAREKEMVFKRCMRGRGYRVLN